MEIERFTMIYEAKRNYKDKLRILGDSFVKNNRNKGRLIIKNKKYNLTSFFSIRGINEDKLKIGLVYNKHIYNKGNIFRNCEELLQCSFHDYNENNENLDNNLQNETKIEDVVEIKENEEIKTINENYNFEKEDSLLYKEIWEYSLYSSTDISKIENAFEDESNISFMNHTLNYSPIKYNILRCMFYNCKSLLSYQI